VRREIFKKEKKKKRKERKKETTIIKEGKNKRKSTSIKLKTRLITPHIHFNMCVIRTHCGEMTRPLCSGTLW
jgi:hypothetical protein